MSLAAAFAVPACSSAAKHRVLSFFFDGVPEPGVPPSTDAPAGAEAAFAQAGTPAEGGVSRPIVYSHQPYRDNRCASCHDPRTGGLFRTPQEGLCRTCHGNVPGDAPHVHGPVAVSDCLFCHHPHTSAHPNLLLADATTTCFRCHDRADLIPGSHHAALEQQTCVECHDAHGGRDRFFLKRNKP